MKLQSQLERVVWRTWIAPLALGALLGLAARQALGDGEKSDYVRIDDQEMAANIPDKKAAISIGRGAYLVKKNNLPGFPQIDKIHDVFVLDSSKWPRDIFSVLRSEDFLPKEVDGCISCERPCVSVGAFMIPETCRAPKFKDELYAGVKEAGAEEEIQKQILFNVGDKLQLKKDGSVKLNGQIDGETTYLDAGTVIVDWTKKNQNIFREYADESIPLHPGFKIDPEIGPENRDLAVTFFGKLGPEDWDKFKTVVQEAGTVLGVDSGDWRRAHVRLIAPGPIYKLANQSFVQWIGREERIEKRSRGTSAIIQSGKQGERPIFGHGIFGEGEVIGLIDNPFDIRHCFFSDGKAPADDHRKIVYYADVPTSSTGLDLHGTMVAGILAGEDPVAPQDTKNGQAPKAKLAFAPLERFEDIVAPGEKVETPGTLQKELEELWEHEARIFSLSWGNDACEVVPGDGNCPLGKLAGDIDRFTATHDEALVVVAISNQEKITSPENSRNALAIGASRQFGFLDPSNFFDSSNPTEPVRDAQRLENRFGVGGKGPTVEKRWKPDVFAPGCRIQSAEAGTPCELADALSDPRSIDAHHGSPFTARGQSGTQAVGANLPGQGDADQGATQFLFDNQPRVRVRPPAARGESTLLPVGDDEPIRSGACATSWAAPAAAGAAALVREYFRKGWYPSGGVKCKPAEDRPCLAELEGKKCDVCKPSGALLKAMLIQSAVPMTKRQAPGPRAVGVPGEEIGFGRLQLDRALFFSDSGPGARRTIVIDTPSGNGVKTHEIGGPYVVRTRGGELKVTLVWTDPVYSVGSPHSKGNDLDLVVTQGVGKSDVVRRVYCGNAFDPTTGRSQEQPDCESVRDKVNNVEQVITVGGENTWKVEVKARYVAEPENSGQRYALVISGEIVNFPSFRPLTVGDDDCSLWRSIKSR